MRPLAVIAATLVLLLGACGLKSDEELAEALLGDVEIDVPTTSTTAATSTSTSTSSPDGSSTTGSSTTEAGGGEDDGGDGEGGDDDGDDGDGGDDDGADLPDGEEPGDLGDDPALDRLADDCFAGDLEACDDLYLESPLGSDYERYGSTCGRRNGETFGGCKDLYDDGAPAVDLPSGEEPGDLGDDPALDELTQRCFEGEMQACDQLYFQSPLGSDYETYGATCGGRKEAEGGSCVATYGPGG